MTDSKLAGEYSVVFGLGKTGISCARFLTQQNEKFCLMDTRDNPPGLEEIQRQYPDLIIQCGDLSESILRHAKEVVLSPGISRKEKLFEKVSQEKIIGDIELFSRYVQAPVVAVTGSNAKSSVTTLIGEFAKAAGKRVAVGGNLGVPVLELLDEQIELYVLELSSFQLELTEHFQVDVAVFLNVCEDHLDRYESLDEYIAAKQKIFKNAKFAVVNADDEQTSPEYLVPKQTSFSSGKPVSSEQYGLINQNDNTYLAKGEKRLCDTAELAQAGRHNYVNALAALAAGEYLGFESAVMLKVLRGFQGLPHRCQVVGTINGVIYIDDSKGTNVGAVLAAVEGLEQGKNIVLIAGGEGKGVDFSPLREVCKNYVKKAILIGRDAKLIAEAIKGASEFVYAEDMQAAVDLAQQTASSGDIALLSPACASFDMFDNYQHRGEAFSECVRRLQG